MASFWGELRRRNVFKVGVAYAIVAWLLVQVSVAVETPLHLPGWMDTFVIVLLIIGFPIALFLTWAYELTPGGVKRIGAGDKQVVNAGPLSVGVTEAATPALDASKQSIAVLPFVNMSSDPEQEYFTDGISEELLNQLTKLRGLHVAGRTSSFYFKNKNENFRVIGDQLNVAHILEGSVRKAGNRVRITAQLIKVADGYHLWSETFDRELDDIFAIQEDIARAVTNSLALTLNIADVDLSAGSTQNFAAYDHYLNGLACVRQTSRDSVIRAIDNFKHAIELDPKFALPWSGLSASYNTAQVFIPENAEEWRIQGERAARRAIELAPELGEAHAALATWLRGKNEWRDAEAEHLKALALTPNLYFTNLSYGVFLLTAGRPQQAIDYFRRARKADPLVAMPVMMLAITQDSLGNHTEALAAYAQARELIGARGPKQGYHLWSVLQADGPAAAKDLLEDYLIGANESIPMPLHAAMVTNITSPEQALAEIRRTFEERELNDSARFVVMAIWAAWFGDPELAIRILRSAVAKSYLPLLHVWVPIMQQVRQQPDFKTLLIDIGLVDYWRNTGNWGDFCRPLGEDDFECE
jgi:TolB-like protein